ncbi:DoxX family protein [Amycolatopsis sp. H20-H5]|uniref:DoxX family protein n=1 Tax=Amycolatopsis sp. H20-H5 TaxID=3046309 RepID=UPI002DB7E888|nr:DoxX family protein [Amycolatopsis sp. H20-H5]MEC3974561.1 DoxX family protein [Amycolatopsis sp. H20-H5]
MSFFDKGRDHVLALFRIVFGFLFLCHGASRLFGLFGGKVVAFGVWPSWWASVIQLVGGAAVMLGIGTRVAAMLCSGSMAFAYFTSHQPDGLLPIQNGGEAATLFCFGFLLIAFAGDGRWSLGPLLRRDPARTPARAAS